MNQKALVAQRLAAQIENLDEAAILDLLETPKSSDLGDIAFPAFSLAKVLRKAPAVIATEIAEAIDTTGFEKVVATGPYVNFFLDKVDMGDRILRSIIEAKETYGAQNIGQGQNITIDMSSPNIAKPFSVGHLRSTVIGDALANLFNKLGYTAVRINNRQVF